MESGTPSKKSFRVDSNLGSALDKMKVDMASDNKGSRIYNGFQFKIRDITIIANHPRISSKNEGLIFPHVYFDQNGE